VKAEAARRACALQGDDEHCVGLPTHYLFGDHPHLFGAIPVGSD
jgi:hypothetical protein